MIKFDLQEMIRVRSFFLVQISMTIGQFIDQLKTVRTHIGLSQGSRLDERQESTFKSLVHFNLSNWNDFVVEPNGPLNPWTVARGFLWEIDNNELQVLKIVWKDGCAEAWMILWIEWMNHDMNESYSNLRHSNLKFWLKFNNEADSSMIASMTVGLKTSMTYRPTQKWFTRSHGRRTFVTRLVVMVMVMTMATHRRVQTENWQTDKHML